MAHRNWLGLAAIACLLAIPCKAEETALSLIDVFVGGKEGYPAYRIPSVITSQRGVLLAFAEGRSALRDHAENDIVLKRSFDGGAHWGSLQLVAEDGANALNNPTAVAVRRGNRIILIYQRYAQKFGEHNAEPGYDGSHICRTFSTTSDDDGANWATPIEITRQVKRPEKVTSTASGPGRGIELERGRFAGRILIPFNQGPYGSWKVYAAFSDDVGRSWRYGETAPEGANGYANEVQFAEMSDGSVVLNARNERGDKFRKIAFSHDGGETWSPTQFDPTLIDPHCQGSLLRLQVNQDPLREVFLFSNPASQSARTNGTVRLSRDEGKSWPVARVIYPGSFAYSCLTTLPTGSVGCLFERDGTKKISFTSFTIDWVERSQPAP